MKTIIGIYILGGFIAFFVVYYFKLDVRWYVRNYHKNPSDLEGRFFDVAGFAMFWPIILFFYVAYNVMDETLRKKYLDFLKQTLSVFRMKNAQEIQKLKKKVYDKIEEDLAKPVEHKIRFEERNFDHADLAHANLVGFKLAGIKLVRANLEGVNLEGANLMGANLSHANLSGANLGRANLVHANLAGANLQWANLSFADLRNANLSDVDLRGTDLSGATLTGAKMRLVIWSLNTRGLPDEVKNSNSVFKSD